MKKRIVIRTLATLVLTVVMVFGVVGCGTTTNEGTDTEETTEEGEESANTDPITVVWYPNESAGDYEESRNEFGKLVEEATGRKVEHKLTTDYVVAIEALASGSADIGAVMGAVGYIDAQEKNPDISTLFVNSGESGTLDDAIYYSWLCVNAADAEQYKDGDTYATDNITGKRMSFVSNSSTSGFQVPTTSILEKFSAVDEWKDITEDDMVEGGEDKFFSEVLFGGSHQGSAFNLVSGKADVAAFCDTEMKPYADIKDGEENAVGAVYTIKDGASAPFDTVGGKEFTIIESTPVLNGPTAYNPENLSEDEVKKIQDLFTSDETATNEKLFYTPDSGNVGFYEKTGEQHYVLVEDAWYDPIRDIRK